MPTQSQSLRIIILRRRFKLSLLAKWDLDNFLLCSSVNLRPRSFWDWFILLASEYLHLLYLSEVFIIWDIFNLKLSGQKIAD